MHEYATATDLADAHAARTQLIGNSVKAWHQYYDLNRILRQGQDALDRMPEWRHNIMQAILMRTPADADQEIDESEDEAEEEQVVHDQELSAALHDAV